MDKTLVSVMGAGLMSAVSALAGPAPAAAATRPAVLEAASYSELLKPVPNAQAALRELDGAEAAQVEEAQYYYRPPPWAYRHHHHHHHHRYWRERYHHHHHHHGRW